jgi:branched-subunit amino acid aminotransferase/4-amino-4-deoxychorismate lyase
VGSSFYVMIFRGQISPESYYTEGMKVITSHVAIKPPYFARVKSTNYLPNALVILDAKDHGADNGIFIDERGLVGESSNMNVAFVTHDRVFRHPKFDAILSGITIQRIMELAQQLVQQGDLKEIVVDDISVEEGRAAAEMMLVGSSIKVAPVVQWDGQPIGDGKPGPIAKKLLDLWNEDRISAADQLLADTASRVEDGPSVFSRCRTRPARRHVDPPGRVDRARHRVLAELRLSPCDMHVQPPRGHEV